MPHEPGDSGRAFNGSAAYITLTKVEVWSVTTVTTDITNICASECGRSLLLSVA